MDVVKGRPYKESPIPALMKFDCQRTYPKKLYDKVVEHGSVASNWLVGGWRSSHLNACREAMVTLIREHRTKHRVASSRDLSASLKKVWKAKITPDYCLKISKHIRKNMLAVVARKGGNFYKD